MTGLPPVEPDQARLLTGREVCQLLNISKSTLQPWRVSGLLVAHELPNGQWRYPEAQDAIQRALEALGRCTVVLR